MTVPPQGGPPTRQGYYGPQGPAPQWYYGTPPPRQSSGISGAAIFVAFIGVLLVLTLVGAVYILLSQPLPPIAPCEPGKACAPPPPPFSGATPAPTITRTTPVPTPRGSALPSPGATSSFAPGATPTSNSPVLVANELWRSATLGYSFEYDPDVFQIFESSDARVVFDANVADAQVIVVGASGDVSPSELIQSELTGDVDSFIIGRTPDKDKYDALLGPSIGYIRGEGSVFSGTALGSDGVPIAPAGVTVAASTDGHITAAVVVIVLRPDVLIGSDTVQYAIRQAADLFLKTFDWNGSR